MKEQTGRLVTPAGKDQALDSTKHEPLRKRGRHRALLSETSPACRGGSRGVISDSQCYTQKPNENCLRFLS